MHRIRIQVLFFGLDLFYGGFHDDYDDESFTSVYTLEEKDLMCIQPSEHNNVNNFKHLFTKINNLMHSHKYHPTLFVANQKLYVISHYCPRNSSFEVFYPSDQTWQVLPSPPYSKGLTLDVTLLVLEQDQTVFFCDFLFSFNLQTNTWTPTTDSIYYPNSDDTPSHPLHSIPNVFHLSVIWFLVSAAMNLKAIMYVLLNDHHQGTYAT